MHVTGNLLTSSATISGNTYTPRQTNNLPPSHIQTIATMSAESTSGPTEVATNVPRQQHTSGQHAQNSLAHTCDSSAFLQLGPISIDELFSTQRSKEIWSLGNSDQPTTEHEIDCSTSISFPPLAHSPIASYEQLPQFVDSSSDSGSDSSSVPDAKTVLEAILRLRHKNISTTQIVNAWKKLQNEQARKDFWDKYQRAMHQESYYNPAAAQQPHGYPGVQNPQNVTLFAYPAIGNQDFSQPDLTYELTSITLIDPTAESTAQSLRSISGNAQRQPLAGHHGSIPKLSDTIPMPSPTTGIAERRNMADSLPTLKLGSIHPHRRPTIGRRVQQPLPARSRPDYKRNMGGVRNLEKNAPNQQRLQSHQPIKGSKLRHSETIHNFTTGVSQGVPMISSDPAQNGPFHYTAYLNSNNMYTANSEMDFCSQYGSFASAADNAEFPFLGYAQSPNEIFASLNAPLTTEEWAKVGIPGSVEPYAMPPWEQQYNQRLENSILTERYAQLERNDPELFSALAALYDRAKPSGSGHMVARLMEAIWDDQNLGLPANLRA